MDYTRCGAGLMEIVSAPDLESALEAVVFVKRLVAIVRAIDASNANMDDVRENSFGFY